MDENNLSKKEWRRLQFLVSSSQYIPLEIINKRINDKSFKQMKGYYSNIKLQIEAHRLFDKLGMDEKARANYWMIKQAERRALKKQYEVKPTRIRKDNKDYINYGTGGSYRGKRIRYPRKKRKTAWKRFYKLFPTLDPNAKK